MKGKTHEMLPDCISECLIFKIFMGAHASNLPRRLVLCTVGCALHTYVGKETQYLIARQFYIWPFKFTFHWPFCPTNNYLLLYCSYSAYLYNSYQVVAVYTYISRLVRTGLAGSGPKFSESTIKNIVP